MLRSVASTLWVVALCISCEKLPTTKSGVEINFIANGNGNTPKHGDIISLNMTYVSEERQMLFDTRAIGAPVQIRFDTSQWQYGGMLYDVLELLEIGDSVQFEIPAENLFEVSFQGELPDSIKAGSDIKFNVGFESAVPEHILTEKRVEERSIVEAEILDNYLKESGIEAEKTVSGLRYVILKEGKGPIPQAGEEVLVHYRGMLLDGTLFDTSEGHAPFQFHLGYGRVIKGWDEGIALMKKGSKATLFIPSSLAYGELGAGRDIGPNAILKFDVELVDIKQLSGN